PPARKRKLSEIIAQTILDEIIADGWRTGTVLGTEPELTSRYEVSRATFREAVRQLERHGAANMKRGSGGGLIVAEPPKGAAMNAMTTFLQLTNVSFADQHELREQLEVTAARLAAERLTPAAHDKLAAAIVDLDRAVTLPDQVAANMRVRTAVAESTNNPSLPVFLQALDSVLYQIVMVMSTNAEQSRRDRELSALYKRNLVAAILKRDPYEAERLVRQDVQRRLLAMTNLITRAGDPIAIPPLDPLRPPDGQTPKLSETVARKIARDIATAHMKEGQSLGNESELQERYKVSRAVLREAIRQLEPHGVVRTQSGFNGGLVVGQVEMDYTTNLVCLYLETTKIAVSHLWEIQSGLERYAAEKLARTCTAADAESLRRCMDELGTADALTFLPRSSRLHQAIATLTGNRALALFDGVLLRYGERVYPAVAPSSIPWLVRSHRNLVEAIVAHDEAAAGQAMAAIYERSRVWITTAK
ncbi:MAG: FadR/GntR family transcriptional regulator, partial [Caulobacterales bacterium]